MSFLPSLSPGNVVDRYLPSDAEFDSNYKWTRPTEWLDLNVPDGVPEKIIGLIAVFPNDKGGSARNYVTFNLDTDDSSSYTVDWGDGNVETVSSNVTVTHIYDYDNITSDTSTMKSTTFRGYRQAKFEVTVQGSARFGGNQGQINFDIDGPYTTQAGYPYRNGANILDLFVSSSLATNPTINHVRNMKMLEQLEFRNTPSNRLTTPEKIYRGCMSLQSIPFVPYVRNTASENYTYAFSYCMSLQYLPDGFADNDKYWFKNPSSLQQAFEYCYRLRYLPEGLFGEPGSVLSSCSSFYLMFRECRNLRYIPYIGMRTSGSNVRVDYMFFNCLDLKAIPKGVHLSNISSAGIDRMFVGCRECYDFSVLDLSTLNRSNIDMTQTFGNLDSLIEFPYIGNFTAANNVEDLLNGSTQLQRFNSQYTHLDFTNVRDMRETFMSCENLKQLPPIHVTALSNSTSLFQTFYNCWSLQSVIFVGMTQGPSDGEYYRMFFNCRSLQYISGVDFSYANDSGDYNQTFNLTRNLARIDFPGSLREGNTKFNLTISGHADISGEYRINTSGDTYNQVGGNGLLLRTEPSEGQYIWHIFDGVDFDPSITAPQGPYKYPFDADWSSSPNTVTFSPIETGFKYSVSLRYCPLNRDAMIEIFNQLVSSGSGTIDLRNNSYTSDLTNDDKAIATDKGYTLNL